MIVTCAECGADIHILDAHYAGGDTWLCPDPDECGVTSDGV